LSFIYYINNIHLNKFNLQSMRLLFLFIFCFVSLFIFANDGIVLSTVNGKPAIEHQVKAGETLYFISKKYNTTVEKIKRDNPFLMENELTIDKTIVVFYDSTLLVDISKADPNTTLPLLHLVKKGETLFGLAKRTYNLEVADLKQWNRLSTNEISIGQALIVGWIFSNTGYAQNTDASSTSIAATVSQNTQPSKDNTAIKTQAKEQNGRIVYVSKGVQTGELTDLKGSKVYTSPKDPFSDKQNTTSKTVEEPMEIVTEKIKTTVAEPVATDMENATSQPVIPEPILSNAPAFENDKRLARDIFAGLENDTSGKYTLKKERGAAKWFKPENASLQLYALHKNAPIGSVLKISNPINNYTIYVKVINNLQLTDENQNALLKISSNAMELLKVYDKVFMVDVSYYSMN